MMKKILLILFTAFVISCSKDDSSANNGPITGIVNGSFERSLYTIGDSLDMKFVLDSFVNKGNSPSINEAILFVNRNEADRLPLNLKPSKEVLMMTLPFKNQLISGTVKANPSQEDIVEIKVILVYSSGINRTFLYIIYPGVKMN